jgi:hypothetical protein
LGVIIQTEKKQLSQRGGILDCILCIVDFISATNKHRFSQIKKEGKRQKNRKYKIVSPLPLARTCVFGAKMGDFFFCKNR